jgi:hypothetical protein
MNNPAGNERGEGNDHVPLHVPLQRRRLERIGIDSAELLSAGASVAGRALGKSSIRSLAERSGAV